jgi:hypothetical protein
MGADFKPFERFLDQATEERSRALLGASEPEAGVKRGSSLTLVEALNVATRNTDERV